MELQRQLIRTGRGILLGLKVRFIVLMIVRKHASRESNHLKIVFTNRIILGNLSKVQLFFHK